MQKKTLIYSMLTLALLLSSSSIFAQELVNKKTWVSGYARSFLLIDDYENSTDPDSVSAKKLLSGHTLLDLAINMKTNKNIFIHGDLRVRNDHGGFWGSGVSFDLRNLYLRGVIADAVRFQVGDVNYKLTPYTFFNPDEEFSSQEPKAFQLNRDLNRHDMFYTDDNTWRTQGVTAEFGLSFKKVIDEIDFNLYTTRLIATEGGGADERLFAGFGSVVKINKMIDGHINYVETFEIEGTGTTDDSFKNNVFTGGVGLHHDIGSWGAHINSEVGTSKYHNNLTGEEVIREDYFMDVDLNLIHENKTADVRLTFQDVGPGFRSIGAQTKRINFERGPRAYSRYGNDQNLRNIGMLDILRDASIYNSRLQTTLMAYNPSYGNFQPYGVATPNRRSMAVEAALGDKKDVVDLNLNYIMGSEIIGEGTPDLRSYNTMTADVEFHVDKLVETISKDIAIQLGFWNEVTSRDGENEFENVDLNNTMISVGASVGLWDEFEFLLGYRALTSEGNEYNTRKDILDEIITFVPFDIDISEDMISAGIRYNFTDKSLINLQWSAYETEDNLNNFEAYNISNWSVIYNLKF